MMEYKTRRYGSYTTSILISDEDEMFILPKRLVLHSLIGQ